MRTTGPSLPEPRTPASRSAPALRWGVLGTGWIAERFLASLQRHTRQEPVAVASRDSARAAAFADAAGVATSYGSYEELVHARDVDVVYVATPHPAHLACALMAIEAGKHVLVEKPLTLDAADGRLIADAASARGVFCMEALWTLLLPRYDVVRQLLDDGTIGRVRTVLAEYGEAFGSGHRILRADLAGGPLLDLGTYPVALSTWVLGAPATVHASAVDHPAGVHGEVAAVLGYPDAQAVVHTTLFSATPAAATIAGERATIHLPGPAYQPGDVVLLDAAGLPTASWTEPRVGHDALHHQAAHVARCITDGLVESPLRPLADSLTSLRALDAIRASAGISFAAARATG